MELKELHQEVDQKLSKIEAEIERFRSNIQSCDDADERTVLEQDLSTLETIRNKLIKAKDITREVTDFRKRVENSADSRGLIAGVPRWFFVSAAVAASVLVAWWVTVV